MAGLNRRLVLPLGVALGGLALIGAVWLGAQSQARFALWQSVADSPLSPSEGDRLARCDRKPGWWTWVKVLHHDRPVPCGEGWAIDRMADKIRRSPDRRRWVRQYVEAPELSPRRRLRASLLLNVVGEPTPDEPAWLSVAELDTVEAEASPVRMAAEGWPWAVQLGPRITAWGTLEGMSIAGATAGDAVHAFEALWATEDPDLAAPLVEQAATGLDVPASLPEDRWYRRRQGRPSQMHPRGWSRLILGRTAACPPDAKRLSEACLTLWRDLLVRQASTDLDDPFEYLPLPLTLQPLLSVVEPQGRRTRAVEWWMQATEDWIRAAPDPDRRLASLADGSTDPELARQAHPIAALYDRTATPFVTAAVVAELARRVDRTVEVRVDDEGTLWIQVGDELVTRPRCGTMAASPPDRTPWPESSLLAAALVEAAVQAPDVLTAARWTAAARALDPAVVPELRPLPADAPAGVGAGYATGARLFAPTVRRDDGGAGARAAVADQIGAACPSS